MLQQKVSDIAGSAAQGCKLCELRLKEVCRNTRFDDADFIESRVDDSRSIISLIVPPGQNRWEWSKKIIVKPRLSSKSSFQDFAETNALRHIETSMTAHRPASIDHETDSTNSYASFESAKEWIRECKLSHSDCDRSEKGTNLPTRRVDLGPGPSIQPRLCYGVNLPSTSKYCTLSHCWGTKAFMKLEREKIDDFEEHIQVKSLQKTFRDAMEVSKRLGVRYIWIDCLCIVQGTRTSSQSCDSLLKLFETKTRKKTG